MSEREKFDRDAQTFRIMERDHWKCQWPGCMNSATEKAHCIARTESNTYRVQQLWNLLYGQARHYKWIYSNVINHDLNMKASCRNCNSKFNIGGQPDKVREKVEEIHQQLTGGSK